MRLVARIPAVNGRVASVTIRVQADGVPAGVAVDVTDVMLQPGDPTGVTPNPSDLAIVSGGSQWRNGVITRSTEVIALANSDKAAPTTIRVVGSGTVRLGSLRLGDVTGVATSDGQAGTTSQGWGRVPVITERSDLHAQLDITSPTQLTIGWVDRS